MKKFLSLVLAATLLLLIPGCQSGGEAAAPSPPESSAPTPETPAESGEASSSPAPAQGSNVLIAYFSWAKNAVLEGDVDAVTSPSVLAPGNVQQLAGWVQEETGGDLFAIQVMDPYPSDWDACLERANQERGDDARPALVRRVENLEQYDVVFLGYPNWWYGVPMALLTFLEENDLSGKQVYLFCSHGTGGLARSVEILTAAAPAASGGAGVLAYYAPWGDVVLFYDGFSENASLFALGRAVSGAESIRDLTGTVTVAVAEG